MCIVNFYNLLYHITIKAYNINLFYVAEYSAQEVFKSEIYTYYLCENIYK